MAFPGYSASATDSAWPKRRQRLWQRQRHRERRRSAGNWVIFDAYQMLNVRESKAESRQKSLRPCVACGLCRVNAPAGGGDGDGDGVGSVGNVNGGRGNWIQCWPVKLKWKKDASQCCQVKGKHKYNNTCIHYILYVFVGILYVRARYSEVINYYILAVYADFFVRPLHINHYKAEEQCRSLTDRATFKLLFVAS